MPSHSGPNTFGEENLVFAYDLGDTVNSYKGPPTQNFAHANVANCSTTSGWDGTSVHTQFGVSRTFGIQKDGRTTLHVMYSPNDAAGTSYPTFRLKDVNGTNVQTNGGEVFYLQFEWKSQGANYLVEGGDNYNLSTFYGNGWKAGTHMSAQDFGSVPIGNGWYRRTVKYTAANVTGQTPLMRFGSGYKRTSGGNYHLWVANVTMTSNNPPLKWLPGQSIRSATQGLIDLVGNSTIDLTNVSFDSNAQVDFDGTDDHVSVGDAAIFNFTSALTIELWTYVTSFDAGGCMFICQQNGATQGGFEFWSQTSGAIRFNSNASVNIAASPSGTFELNKWQHLVCTADGTTGKIYVNGELVATNSAGLPDNVNGDLRIGDWPLAGYRVNGSIPVVKMYNQALTAEEVAENFNGIRSRFGI